MRIVLAALALVFAVQSRAEAGILVEPYLGYQMMLTDLKLGAGAGSLDGQSVKVDGSGVGYGLRAGITLPMIFAAVRARANAPKSSSARMVSATTNTILPA